MDDYEEEMELLSFSPPDFSDHFDQSSTSSNSKQEPKRVPGRPKQPESQKIYNSMLKDFYDIILKYPINNEKTVVLLMNHQNGLTGKRTCHTIRYSLTDSLAYYSNDVLGSSTQHHRAYVSSSGKFTDGYDNDHSKKGNGKKKSKHQKKLSLSNMSKCISTKTLILNFQCKILSRDKRIHSGELTTGSCKIEQFIKMFFYTLFGNVCRIYAEILAKKTQFGVPTDHGIIIKELGEYIPFPFSNNLIDLVLAEWKENARENDPDNSQFLRNIQDRILLRSQSDYHMTNIDHEKREFPDFFWISISKTNHDYSTSLPLFDMKKVLMMEECDEIETTHNLHQNVYNSHPLSFDRSSFKTHSLPFISNLTCKEEMPNNYESGIDDIHHRPEGTNDDDGLDGIIWDENPASPLFSPFQTISDYNQSIQVDHNRTDHFEHVLMDRVTEHDISNVGEALHRSENDEISFFHQNPQHGSQLPNLGTNGDFNIFGTGAESILCQSVPTQIEKDLFIEDMPKQYKKMFEEMDGTCDFYSNASVFSSLLSKLEEQKQVISGLKQDLLAMQTSATLAMSVDSHNYTEAYKTGFIAGGKMYSSVPRFLNTIHTMIDMLGNHLKHTLQFLSATPNITDNEQKMGSVKSSLEIAIRNIHILSRKSTGFIHNMKMVENYQLNHGHDIKHTSFQSDGKEHKKSYTSSFSDLIQKHAYQKEIDKQKHNKVTSDLQKSGEQVIKSKGRVKRSGHDLTGCSDPYAEQIILPHSQKRTKSTLVGDISNKGSVILSMPILRRSQTIDDESKTELKEVTKPTESTILLTTDAVSYPLDEAKPVNEIHVVEDVQSKEIKMISQPSETEKDTISKKSNQKKRVKTTHVKKELTEKEIESKKDKTTHEKVSKKRKRTDDGEETDKSTSDKKETIKTKKKKKRSDDYYLKHSIIQKKISPTNVISEPTNKKLKKNEDDQFFSKFNF